jgi:hypothetical protein
MKRREKVLEKISKNREEHIGKLDKKDEKKDEKKEKKIKELKNAQNLAKIQLEKLLAEQNKEDLPKAQEMLGKIKSRGLKQRLHKKINQAYGLNAQGQNNIKEAKKARAKANNKVNEKTERKEKEIKERREQAEKRFKEEDEILKVR